MRLARGAPDPSPARLALAAAALGLLALQHLRRRAEHTPEAVVARMAQDGAIRSA